MRRCKVEPLDGVSQWYRRLWLEPQWRADAAARWAELRQERLSDAWFVEEIATVLGAPGGWGFYGCMATLPLPLLHALVCGVLAYRTVDHARASG